MQSAQALAAITAVLCEHRADSREDVTGKDAQELVMCQGRDDFFAVTFTRGKVGRTGARNLAADGRERQQLIIETVVRR